MILEDSNFSQKYDFENKFYLTCDTNRIGKLLTHYELLKQTVSVPGLIAEFGIFKGVSFARLAMFRELLGIQFCKGMVGFDIFGKFPETEFDADQETRQRFIDAAGDESISYEEMCGILEKKKLMHDITLIKGDILETLPAFLKQTPACKFSFINLDTDIYEPARCILENCWDRLSIGGALLLDDYTFFSGENKAVDDFFADKKVTISVYKYAKSPCYVIKK